MLRFSLLCLAAVSTLFAATAAPGAAVYQNKTLYTFCPQIGCADGSLPYAGLVMDRAGNLYGTVSQGGANNNAGAVFELAPDATRIHWTETLLHSFCARANCTDGSTPYSGLIMDRAGNLYGTTNGGGKNKAGVVFELTPNAAHIAWKETVLYSFCSEANCADGSGPAYGRLLMDRAGNLYGTTQNGGNGGSNGVVFKLAPDAKGGWTETVLWAFCPLGSPCLDGGAPAAGLIIDNSGNLYGTTLAFGAGSRGVVFKVTPHGSETVLYPFCSQMNCVDGALPFAGLTLDGSKHLYGSTSAGGLHGQGVVYELADAGGHWQERVLYSFCPRRLCRDGAQPWAGLIADRPGNLYGSTTAGGTAGNAGVVFRLAPHSPTGVREQILRAFCSEANCSDGLQPHDVVIRDRSGNLYGTTLGGGISGHGVVFELVKHP